ncbi:MAG: hypothetical protein LBM67_04570, partial [Lentimicrobiaceae bacterium]|nr:hypothetical protein [Lentimicrobiaceae bacterium]
GETLETEEAMWHLTALLNFDYGDAGHEFSEFVNDTSYIVISKTDDGVSYEELNNAYTDLQEFVETAYETSDLDDKHVYVVVAKAVSEDDENMTIETVSTLGTLGSYSSTFGPTDYWYFCCLEGKCGEYEGQYVGRDATTELTSKLNTNKGVLAAVGGRIYYTDVHSKYLYGAYTGIDNIADPNSPCGYRIFFQMNDDNAISCFCPDDMNYYLWSYNDLGNQYKPEGQHIISFLVEYDYIASLPVSSSSYILTIDYGTANVISTGADF